MKEKDRQKEHLLSIAGWVVKTDFICWLRELKMASSFALSAESANEIKIIRDWKTLNLKISLIY